MVVELESGVALMNFLVHNTLSSYMRKIFSTIRAGSYLTVIILFSVLLMFVFSHRYFLRIRSVLYLGF